MSSFSRVALLMLFIPAARLSAQATPAAATNRGEVRTEATAERQVRPDLAVITFSFTADGRSAREAGRRIAARADTLRRAFEALGVPHDSLLTANRWYWGQRRMEVTPRSRPDTSKATGFKPYINDTLYRANDAIEVHLRDVSRVGAAIDSALAHKVTDISPVRFSATEITAPREAATREATEAARRSAEIVAAASGGTLGRTLLLSTSPNYDYGGYGGYGLYGMAGGGGGSVGVTADSDSRPGTEVVFPQISVRVTVYGRWELVGKP